MRHVSTKFATQPLTQEQKENLFFVASNLLDSTKTDETS